MWSHRPRSQNLQENSTCSSCWWFFSVRAEEQPEAREPHVAQELFHLAPEPHSHHSKSRRLKVISPVRKRFPAQTPCPPQSRRFQKVPEPSDT